MDITRSVCSQLTRNTKPNAVCGSTTSTRALSPVPAFYALSSAQRPSSRGESTNRLQAHITSLVLAADEEGPFFTGSSLSLVDLHFVPFALRLSRILLAHEGLDGPCAGDEMEPLVGCAGEQSSCEEDD